MQVKKDKKRRL